MHHFNVVPPGGLGVLDVDIDAAFNPLGKDDIHDPWFCGGCWGIHAPGQHVSGPCPDCCTWFHPGCCGEFS